MEAYANNSLALLPSMFTAIPPDFIKFISSSSFESICALVSTTFSTLFSFSDVVDPITKNNCGNLIPELDEVLNYFNNITY